MRSDSAWKRTGVTLALVATAIAIGFGLTAAGLPLVLAVLGALAVGEVFLWRQRARSSGARLQRKAEQEQHPLRRPVVIVCGAGLVCAWAAGYVVTNEMVSDAMLVVSGVALVAGLVLLTWRSSA